MASASRSCTRRSRTSRSVPPLAVRRSRPPAAVSATATSKPAARSSPSAARRVARAAHNTTARRPANAGAGAGRRRSGVAGRERQLDPEPRAGAVQAVDADGPPIASARRRQMASPRPMPPCRRVVEVSPWTNASNRSGAVSALTPTPVSSNSMRTPPPAATAARTRTLPVSVKVIAFDSSLRTMRRTRAASPTTSAGSAGSITAARSRPFSWARAGVDLDGGVDDRGEIEGRVRQRQRAALERGVVDRVLDDRQHRLAGGEGRRDVLVLLRRQRRLEQQAGAAEHGVHRRLELVAHRGEEGRPRPRRGIGLAPRVGELALEAGNRVAHRGPPARAPGRRRAGSAWPAGGRSPTSDRRRRARSPPGSASPGSRPSRRAGRRRDPRANRWRSSPGSASGGRARGRGCAPSPRSRRGPACCSPSARRRSRDRAPRRRRPGRRRRPRRCSRASRAGA